MGGAPLGRRPLGRAARKRQARRILAFGMIASVVAHLLTVVLSPILVRYVPGASGRRPLQAIAPAGQGTRVVDIVITEEPQLLPEPAPETERETPQPQLEPTPSVPDPREVRLLSAAERLRIRVGDWRLWVMPPIRGRERTPAEREADLNERLFARIAQLNDSLAAEDARRLAARDWTVGEEGNKWGISPDGKIHLGPITLPFPFSIGPTREGAEKAAEWEAIQRQVGRAGIDEVFDDRVKAIRERKEEEKAEKEKAEEEKAKQDTTSNGNR